MNENEGKIKILGIIMLLLVFPLILFWREMLIIALIFVVATIIYKIIKALCIKDEVAFSGGFVEREELYQEDVKQNYQEYIKNKYVEKGINAEQGIIKILERIYCKENIIHDSYFRDEQFVTTQVDIVAVDTSGIYVIESKAYSSIVKGNTKEKNWVQLFGGKKYQIFSNPVIQNKRHVNAIKHNLKQFALPDAAFKSYVVFDNNCKLDVQIDKGCDTRVLQQKSLFYTILEDRKITKNIIDEDQVQVISKRINAHANVDEKMKMDHVIRRQNNIRYDTKGR